MTYPSVLPDVDLAVTVDQDGTGFSEVLIVRTPQAAANPALSEVSFPISTDGGLTVTERDGGFAAVDSSGVEVFESLPPRMWDSSGGAAVDVAGGAARSSTKVGAASSEDRLRGPLAGDVVAQMPAEYADGAVSITPDRQMLDSPDTAWPVYVDPTWDAGEGVTLNAWAMIQSAFGGDDANYKNWSTEGFGFCDVSLDYTCEADNKKRLLYKFNIPSAIRGSHVTSAELSAYQPYAYDCDTGFVQLFRVPSFSSSTTWDNFHSHMDDGGDAISSVDETRRSGCALGPGWTRLNAYWAADWAADNDASTVSLGIRSPNENSYMSTSWKHFRSDATLSITFNRNPNTPAAPTIDPTVRAGSGPDNWLVRDATPRFSVTLSDPDGGTLQAFFQVWDGSTLVWEGQTPLVASGSNVTSPSSSTLQEGRVYGAKVLARDSAGLNSYSWSSWISFKVDMSPPGVPKAIPQTSGTGVEAVYLEDDWAGGIGQTGKFRFDADGATDAARFRYSFNSSTYTDEVDANSSGQSVDLVPFTPDSPGTNILRVWAIDKAGWVGSPRLYYFAVNVSATAAWWGLDGNGSDKSASGTNPVTVTSAGTSWVDGSVGPPAYPGDQALRLDGQSGSAYTSYPLVQGTDSFTVAAVVRTADLSTTRVAVSQDGVNISQFKLGQLNYSSLCPSTGSPCWAFWLANEDDAGSTHTRVVPTVSPTRDAIVTNEWTALVGVYDADAGELRLYVNGHLAGVTPYTVTWDGTDNFRIGRAEASQTPQYYWQGDIDDVRIYRNVLDDATIWQIAQGSREEGEGPL